MITVLCQGSGISLAEQIRNCVAIPVMAEPNAGMPEMQNGRTVYTENPTVFACNMRRIKDLGVNVIGGCCGTTPEHIRQTALKINE